MLHISEELWKAKQWKILISKLITQEDWVVDLSSYAENKAPPQIHFLSFHYQSWNWFLASCPSKFMRACNDTYRMFQTILPVHSNHSPSLIAHYTSCRGQFTCCQLFIPRFDVMPIRSITECLLQEAQIMTLSSHINRSSFPILQVFLNDLKWLLNPKRPTPYYSGHSNWSLGRWPYSAFNKLTPYDTIKSRP